MQFAGLFASLESHVSLQPTVHHAGLKAPLGDDAVLDQPLIFTLARLALLKETGRLELILASGETMELTLIEGIIQTWKSFSRSESQMALELMRQREQFSPDVLEELEEKSKTLERNVLHILLANGDMRPTEVVQLIRSIYREYLKTALASPEGSLVFNQQKPDQVKPGPVPTPIQGLNLAVMAELVASWSPEDRETLLNILNGHAVALQEEHIALINKWLGHWGICTPQVLQSMRNEEPWEKIRDLGDHRIVVGLAVSMLIGAAQVTQLEEVIVKSPSLLKSERIISELRNADLFERLELHWTVHPDAILPAYSARMTDLENRLDTEVLPKMRALLAESKNGLATEEQRIAYRNEKYGSRLVRDRSDFLLQQVRRNCMRNEWLEALKALESLLDMGIRTAEVLDLLDTAKTQLRWNASP